MYEALDSPLSYNCSVRMRRVVRWQAEPDKCHPRSLFFPFLAANILAICLLDFSCLASFIPFFAHTPSLVVFHTIVTKKQSATHGGDDSRSTTPGPRAVRHCVDSQVPDGSIASLYPLRDNYVIVSSNLRSPKSLKDLCLDTVCRSLPDMEGELPPGLPQDLVDSIVKSLVSHSALNVTTLRALRHCEIGELNLAGCRGVGDDWLRKLNEPCLNTGGDSYGEYACNNVEAFADSMDVDTYEQEAELSTTYPCSQYESATGFAFAHPPPQDQQGYAKGSSDASSCSSSSFVSAVQVQDGDVSMESQQPPTTPTKMPASFEPTNGFLTPQPKYFDNHKLYAPHPHSPWPNITTQLKVLDLRGSQRLTDRGLLQLGDLNALEVAKLDNCHSIQGRGLLVFSNSLHLHTLSLANCRRITDEAIVNVSHLSSIVALILDGCRCLTDRSLAAISDLYQLQKLDLSQCDLVTNSGLNYLRDLHHLEELSLGWCRNISDDGIKLLASQPMRDNNLKILRIARCQVSDEGIESLGKLASLQELNLNGCSNVSGAALGNTLQKLPNLEVLDASYCPGIL